VKTLRLILATSLVLIADDATPKKPTVPTVEAKSEYYRISNDLKDAVMALRAAIEKRDQALAEGKALMEAQSAAGCPIVDVTGTNHPRAKERLICGEPEAAKPEAAKPATEDTTVSATGPNSKEAKK